MKIKKIMELNAWNMRTTTASIYIHGRTEFKCKFWLYSLLEMSKFYGSPKFSQLNVFSTHGYYVKSTRDNHLTVLNRKTSVYGFNSKATRKCMRSNVRIFRIFSHINLALVDDKNRRLTNDSILATVSIIRVLVVLLRIKERGKFFENKNKKKIEDSKSTNMLYVLFFFLTITTTRLKSDREKYLKIVNTTCISFWALIEKKTTMRRRIGKQRKQLYKRLSN